jgi:hypothetical protein
MFCAGRPYFSDGVWSQNCNCSADETGIVRTNVILRHVHGTIVVAEKQ